MNGVVLKLINAPINDLSVFPFQLGFSLFFPFDLYACVIVLFLSFVYLYFHIYILYVDDRLIDLLYSSYGIETYSEGERPGLNAMPVSAIANAHCSYGGGEEGLINI